MIFRYSGEGDELITPVYNAPTLPPYMVCAFCLICWLMKRLDKMIKTIKSYLTFILFTFLAPSWAKGVATGNLLLLLSAPLHLSCYKIILSILLWCIFRAYSELILHKWWTTHCHVFPSFRSPWLQRVETVTAGSLSQGVIRMTRTVLMTMMMAPEMVEEDTGTG